MQRKVWNGKAVASAACLMLVCSTVVFAQTYGADIKAVAVNLYTWMRAMGGAMMAIGLGWCGMKITVQHDTEHLKTPILVTAGGLITLLAPSIVALLQGLTSGAAQTIN